ncbi:hypothetical protein EV426DRAFT_679551 [Tirmania nivea]|nr:hypothetical protein EV426DRAFT_679551 [Tirmania nivea]
MNICYACLLATPNPFLCFIGPRRHEAEYASPRSIERQRRRPEAAMRLAHGRSTRVSRVGERRQYWESGLAERISGAQSLGDRKLDMQVQGDLGGKWSESYVQGALGGRWKIGVPLGGHERQVKDWDASGRTWETGGRWARQWEDMGDRKKGVSPRDTIVASGRQKILPDVM